MSTRGLRSSANTRGATPGASGVETQSTQGTVGNDLAERLEAARRRMAELEEEAQRRDELEAMRERIRQLEGANTPAVPQREPVAVPTTVFFFFFFPPSF